MFYTPLCLINDSLCLLIWLLLIINTVALFIGESNGILFQYSCLENPMGRGDWRSIVHRDLKSWTARTHAGISSNVALFFEWEDA